MHRSVYRTIFFSTGEGPRRNAVGPKQLRRSGNHRSNLRLVGRDEQYSTDRDDHRGDASPKKVFDQYAKQQDATPNPTFHKPVLEVFKSEPVPFKASEVLS